MNSRVYWLTLLMLLGGVLACDVSSLASTMPTSTPDRIATGVAGTETAVAEQTAIAATVIAKAPESTLTSLPPASADAYVRSTSPTPTISRAPTSTQDKLVLGNEYGIKVSASKINKISGTAGDLQSDPGYTFLRVQAKFYKRGTEWETTNGKESRELSLVDSKGETYSKQFVYVVFACDNYHMCVVASQEPDVVWSSWVGNSWVEEISGWTQPNRGDWRTIGVGVITYFPVPEMSTGFRLRYRDLPFIDLEPVPYAPPPPTYAPSPTRPPPPTYAPSPTVASKPAM